jgi:hypothetical protein
MKQFVSLNALNGATPLTGIYENIQTAPTNGHTQLEDKIRGDKRQMLANSGWMAYWHVHSTMRRQTWHKVPQGPLLIKASCFRLQALSTEYVIPNMSSMATWKG